MSESVEYEKRTLASLVERHETDLYRGNGKPGIITRIQLIEDSVESLNEYNNTREERQDRKFNIILAALITVILTSLVNIFIHH